MNKRNSSLVKTITKIVQDIIEEGEQLNVDELEEEKPFCKYF